MAVARWIGVVALVLALAAPPLPAAPKKGSGKPASKKPDDKSAAAAVEIKPLDPLVTLAGQAAPPAYLRFAPTSLISLDGVSHGDVRTVDADFASKDFVFDVVMKFEPEDNEFVFGIGENGRQDNWILNSVGLRWSGRSGYADVIETNKDRKSLTRADVKGTHLLRMEKQGDALTLTIATRAGDADPFKVAGTKKLADFKKKASFLTDKNATLFFGGDGVATAVALSVGGKMVDAGRSVAAGPTTNAATAAAASAIDRAPLLSLAGAAGLPSWLKCDNKVLADAAGLSGGEVRTAANDLVERDFAFDLLFKFENDQDKAIFLVGLGENGREGGWILNSVYSRVHGPGHKGNCTLALGKTGHGEERSLGSFGANPGPHLMRIEKRGPALTMGVCVDYKDKYVPSFAKTVPDLKKVAPFFTKLNGGLFFDGNGGARLMAARFVVDGQPAENKTPAVASAASAAADAVIEKAPLASLAGQAGLPAWLKADAKALAGPDGIRGGEMRTADHDLIAKDFTFDLVYEFKDDEHAIFYIGMGEHGHEGGWILNSVLSRVHGPGHGGFSTVTFRSPFDEPVIGRTAKDPGPHMFRLQKRGNTLTMSICADFKDKFEPTFSKTIPDLAKSAPFLNKTNSNVFVAGDCTFKAVRFVVNGTPPAGAGGTPVASATGTSGATGKVAPGTAAAADSGIEDKTPLVSLAGSAGLPAWLKGSAKTLAGPDGIKGGELRTALTDLGNHDFTFDVLYQFAEGEGGITLVGIGTNTKEGGWIRNTVCARVHGPEHDGMILLLTPDIQMDQPTIGKAGKEAGPHLLRLQKRGQTLTMAVDVNYTGDRFAADFSRTLPDLAGTAKFLSPSTGSLFIEAGHTIKAVRLVVDGKVPVGKTLTAVATAGGGKPLVTGPGGGRTTAVAPPPAMPGPDGTANLLALAGPRLPTFFKQQRGLAYKDGALDLKDGKTVRTVRSDYLNKDFTFDVVYRNDHDEHAPLVVGLGENGREGGWILNSVVAKLHGARHDGLEQLVIGKEGDHDLGKVGKTDGACMFRLQKRGNALTLAVCADFQGKFDPTVSRTIPDLKSVAPFLTDKNAFLFISDKGKVEKVRLVIAGEAIESLDVALGVPPRVVEGQPVRLQLSKADKNSAGAKYEVEKGPQGLTITPAGDLAWTPARDQVGGQELRVRVAKGGQTLVVPGEVEVVSTEDAKAVKGDLSKVDSLYKLAVQSEHYKLVNGLGNRSMLLLDGDSLRRLDADGITVRETLKLPAKYKLIGERDGYFVAVSDERQSLDILDKKTLAVRKSVQMVYRNRWDLALHPFKAISYVTVEKGADGARDGVLIVDETAGDVLEPEDFVGRWIKLSPDGRTAYTAYKDIYEKGSRLLVNPDRIHIIPEYGSIDVLYVYDLSAGRPRVVRMKDSPGLNGFGLALSPDGRRVSYLSFTGFPLYSHNVPAFDPTNFERRPVTYATKDNRAGSQDLAYHPYLEIAAAPSEDGAVCFDREGGQVLPGLANLSAPPLGEVTAKHVYFSPDGRSLLIECDNGADRYLRKVKLNLSPAQVEKVNAMQKQGPPAAPPPAGPGPAGQKVNLPKV